MLGVLLTCLVSDPPPLLRPTPPRHCEALACDQPHPRSSTRRPARP